MTDIYLGVNERDKSEAVAKFNDVKLPIQKPELVPQSEIQDLIQPKEEIAKS